MIIGLIITYLVRSGKLTGMKRTLDRYRMSLLGTASIYIQISMYININVYDKD